MADCVQLWVEVFTEHARVRIDDKPPVEVEFSIPVDQADLSTLTSPLVFKQTAGNAESDFARDIGMRLFGAVFSGAAIRLYANAVGTDDRRRTGVWMHIVATSADLQALPWELLYDRSIKRDFLALVPGFTICRQTHYGVSSGATPANHPGVLFVGGSTQALPFVPSNATVSDQESAEFPHIVHVLGDQASALDFSARRPPRLLILDGSATDRAAAKHAAKVPAVLGFRTPSGDKIRTTFLTELYRAIGRHGAIELAVAKARAAVDLSEPGRPDWSFSVLYRNGTGTPSIRLSARPSQPATDSSQRTTTPPVPLRPDLRDEAEYLTTMIRVSRANLATLRDRWPDDSDKGMPEPVRRHFKALLARLKCDKDRLKEVT